MNEHELEEELQAEEEVDDAPFVEFDISISPADPTLELLANKIENGEIIVPLYQRKFVWKIEQASKLIESFLMGLPIPQVFLYVNDQEQLEIIDGQQRIMTVKYFFEGYFGEKDAQGKRTIFNLKGLSERSEYNGKKFNELTGRDQRRLKNATLRAIHIKQLKPSLRSDSVYHIFERLNTGGTQLKPQEIRNAIYRGEIVGRIKELNENKDWRKIIGMKNPDKNQKDVEMILRLYALYKNWDNYEKPMLGYLNHFMDANRDFNNPKTNSFVSKFNEISALIANELTKPFRPKGVINFAMLEAVMIALMEAENFKPETLKSIYDDMVIDKRLDAFIRGSTTDTLVLKSRIRVAKEVFF